MTAFIVAYDLFKQGQNYRCLIEKLQAYPKHWHMQQSVWIVSTNESSNDIYEKLGSCLDANDKIFVAGLSGDATWTGRSDEIDAWLQRHLV